MPKKDIEKKRAYQREWMHRKRRDGTLKTTWQDKKSALIAEHKNVPCGICGETFPECCMDMHHRNVEEKLYEIAWLQRHKAFHYLEEELEKCTALCAHCHRKLHAGLIQLPC